MEDVLAGSFGNIAAIVKSDTFGNHEKSS